MTKSHRFTARKCLSWIGSRQFFWLVIVLFVLESAWIALTGRYPMAFDEDFHVGIIRLYAHHISVFWSGQPANADQFGAVARDPSYLYQYLMSFPYRLISIFTTNNTVQVLILRFINIGLFTSGLVLFRYLLLKTKASTTLVNSTFVIFILLPIAPLLAAQINYDNLFMPMVALALLLTYQFDHELTTNHRLDLLKLLQLAVICLLTSLVKYAFLPILLTIAGFVIIRWLIQRKQLKQATLASIRQQLSTVTWLMIAAFIVVASLFVERYGINMVRYHKPVPDCSQVLSVRQCSQYGPWIRDYNFELARINDPDNPLTYTQQEWFYGMWLRTFFAVDGPASQFETQGPLLVPSVAAIVLAVASVLVFLTQVKRVFRRYDSSLLWLFVLVITSFVFVLWLDEYLAYVRTVQPVAINGRYLLPLAMPALLLAGLGWAELLRQRPAWKLTLAATATICLLWGGGALTYILRSNDSWYWHNTVVIKANHAVKGTVGPVTPGFRQDKLFLR